MNLSFINPPFKGRFSRTSRSPAVAKGGTLYYPLWLSYAAGVAIQTGHNVQLCDAPAENLSCDDILSRLDDFNPGLVVVDTSTPSISNDVKIAAEIKKGFPSAFIVLVGTHPSALPEECLSMDRRIDAVAIAEFDYTIRDLADCLEQGRPIDAVNGLVFRKNGKFFKTADRHKITDLDDFPFVSSVYKNHLNIENYFFAAANYPMMMIMTGRGCPHKCFFCVYPQVFHGRFYRVRSPENVVAEFEYIVHHFPEVKEVGIEDDCFTANPKRVKKICELLIERKIKIPWYCNVRGDVDYSLLQIMKNAGCRLVTVGFESGCQEILDRMNKGETIDRYLRFARDAKKAGILVHGCIMTGNPGDTKETLAESYNFAKKINCDSMQFYPLYVYPGTEAYEWAEANGYIRAESFSDWLTEDGLHNCVIDIPGFSSEDMVHQCDVYLKKYHLRPKYLFMKSIQAIRNPSEGYRSIKSARSLLAKSLDRHDAKGCSV